MTFIVKSNVLKLSKVLDEYPVKTFPALGQFIVNKMAFEGMKQAHRRIGKQFITRNKFTIKNIQFDKAKKVKRLKDAESSYGATDKIEYMRDQEEGVTLHSTSGSHIPIPTRVARKTNSIKKLKRGKFTLNSLGNVRKTSEMRGKTKKQRTIALIQDMLRKKQQANRLALLPFKNKPGIYKILSAGEAKKGVKTRFKFRLKQIYDLSKRSLKLEASPWMAPVNKGIFKHQGKIAEAAFRRFIKVVR